jgi:hypothetical protein
MDDMPIEDIKRDLVGTLISYKGIPNYVLGIEDNKALRITEIGSFIEKKVPYTEVSSLRGRIGMVSDEAGQVYYVSRLPARKLFIGLNSAVMNYARVYEIRNGPRNHLDDLVNFRLRSLSNAIMGEYPSIPDALKVAKDFKGAMPFDRQFAIDFNRNIYYKDGRIVGKLPEKGTTVHHIRLVKACEYLRPLLENICEKTVRTFK